MTNDDVTTNLEVSCGKSLLWWHWRCSDPTWTTQESSPARDPLCILVQPSRPRELLRSGRRASWWVSCRTRWRALGEEEANSRTPWTSTPPCPPWCSCGSNCCLTSWTPPSAPCRCPPSPPAPSVSGKVSPRQRREVPRWDGWWLSQKWHQLLSVWTIWKRQKSQIKDF